MTLDVEQTHTSAGIAPKQSGVRDLLDRVNAHDLRVGHENCIWLGSEPTFTDRSSEAAEWLKEALGEDKEERARRLIQLLHDRHPGGAVLRSVGRQYAGESLPRWSYGLYTLRSGAPIWTGPPDRLRDPSASAKSDAELEPFRACLTEKLQALGWFVAPVSDAGTADLRMLFRPDGEPASTNARDDERLARPSLHTTLGSKNGPVDSLAEEGSLLLLLHPGADEPELNQLWLELPGFTKVSEFASFLGALSATCHECKIDGLGLRGFPPPVDATVAWTTLTPDPAVLEVNQAPQPDARSFLEATKTLFELTHKVGLSSYRLQYNGTVSDSGGGGQLTFGGSSPEHSPFFTEPKLLPRLIRYVIRHPSLSYWFATQYVGGSSQSPRPDEGVRESFLELDVALEQLSRLERCTPEILWSSLRDFMVDASGNPHRSELNIEKLFNPTLPGRGCLGLVELRALAMAQSVEVSSARALLFRGILAMLQRENTVGELSDWRDELHDRFALPYFIREDLREVLSDLTRVGLGLGPELEALLLAKEHAVLGRTELLGAEVALEQAIEFWPLLGDVASQEGGGSRLVDASTSRYEVRLSAPADAAAVLDALEVTANGYRVPLQTELSAERATRLLGLRFRSFNPYRGLHPAMTAEPTIVLGLKHAAGPALRVTLHPWRPDGGAYPGLPKDLEEARMRRLERVVVEHLDASDLAPALEPPAHATTAYCLDLRRLPNP